MRADSSGVLDIFALPTDRLAPQHGTGHGLEPRPALAQQLLRRSTFAGAHASE